MVMHKYASSMNTHTHTYGFGQPILLLYITLYAPGALALTQSNRSVVAYHLGCSVITCNCHRQSPCYDRHT